MDSYFFMSILLIPSIIPENNNFLQFSEKKYALNPGARVNVEKLKKKRKEQIGSID